MKFGIHIGHMGGPLAEMRKLWKFADTKGFDWFSVSDHFQESPPRGGDMDCYEAIATLTAAAMDTTHIRLGSGVYCVVYRNPGLCRRDRARELTARRRRLAGAGMTKGGGGDQVAQRRRRSRRGGDGANASYALAYDDASLRIRLRAIGLALVVLWAPLVAEGQQADKVHRIGILFNSTREQNASNVRALEQGLQEHGYVEGRNLTIERRFADSIPERLPVLAAELATLNLDVIVVNINRLAVAVKQVTTKIPIVMAVAEDPVDVGLVKSLAHPGGNITGVTVMAGREIYSKNLELLKEVLPKGARIAVLYDTTSPIHPLFLKVLDEAARKLQVRLVPTGIRSVEDFEKAFTLMKQERASGFLVLGGGPPSSHRQRINDLAVRKGLACMWPTREGVHNGGLIGYGVHVADLFRRAAPYVDKILKGAMPADLPMEQPTKFWLSINLKTAKTLGLTMPPSLLLRADEVIQ